MLTTSQETFPPYTHSILIILVPHRRLRNHLTLVPTPRSKQRSFFLLTPQLSATSSRLWKTVDKVSLLSASATSGGYWIFILFHIPVLLVCVTCRGTLWLRFSAFVLSFDPLVPAHSPCHSQACFWTRLSSPLLVFDLWFTVMSLTDMKWCATLGCTNPLFIVDSHLDCINCWDCEKTSAWNNPDRIPCMFCRNWSRLQVQGAQKRWLVRDWQLKLHQSRRSLFSPPPIPLFPAPDEDCHLSSSATIFHTISSRAVFLTDFFPDMNGCPRTPAPAAASSLADLTLLPWVGTPITPPWVCWRTPVLLGPIKLTSLTRFWRHSSSRWHWQSSGKQPPVSDWIT